MMTMFGWVMRAQACASRKNRVRSSGVTSRFEMTLRATERCRIGSRARKIVPMPPRPIWSITSYLPIFSAIGPGLTPDPSQPARRRAARDRAECKPANFRRANFPEPRRRAPCSRSEANRDAVEEVVSGELGIRRGRSVAVREAVSTELHEAVAAEQLGVPREPPRQPGAPAEAEGHGALAPDPRLSRVRHAFGAREKNGRPERQIRGERAERGRARRGGPPKLEIERHRRAEQIRIDEPIRRAAERRIFGPDHRSRAERRDAEPRGVDPE